MDPLIFLSGWLLIIAVATWAAALCPDAAWVRAVDRLGGPQEPRTPAQQQYSRRWLFAQGASFTLLGVWLLAYDLTALGQQLRGRGYGPSFYLLALVIPLVCHLPVLIVWLKRPR